MSEIDYANISPYTDEQAVEALHKVARNPMLPVISKFLFPDEPFYSLHRMLKSINSIDEFHEVVVAKMVVADVQRTASGFTYEGIEHLDTGKTFLAVSNHRDIILDPALIQWTLFHNKMPLTEICVGSNLLEGNKIVADLLRSNRMIKVIRGISARELYLSSKLLSSYIRSRVASGEASVWVAQREGRTKNGIDLTEQGLLKMFDMSGTKGFKENFMELKITPMSISYEYESCDMKKARELYLSKDRKYVKKRTEDLHSIMTGIKQWKGRIHLSIDTPLTEEEIERASICDKNDRYQYIRHVLDYRIVKLYKLWKTNYMGYDLMNRTTKYSSLYGNDVLEAFKAYTEHKLSKVERNLDRDALRQLFWEIYGNPVARKEELCPID